MLFAVAAILVGTPILWAMSVGALREVRRLQAQDPPWTGCPVWVRVRGVPGRRYRCAQRPAHGGTRCPQHEASARRGELHEPAGRDVEEPQDVGRALAQARLAIPLAVALVLTGVVTLVALG
ncbi:MAG: hypothetical protein JJT89_11035 [Nitriliruptoraceae bacterium]|nr:hypothetical protein [Nitriliruptoraceae bacterium]